MQIIRRLKLPIKAFYYTLCGLSVFICSLVSIFFFAGLIPLEACIKQIHYDDTNALGHLTNLKKYLENYVNKIGKRKESLEKEWTEIQKDKLNT